MIKHVLATLLIVLLISCQITAKYDNVEHVIVIVMENWSFDGLFGVFDKANGFKNAPETAKVQLDRQNKKYDTIPQVQHGIPTDLPNTGPFDLSKYVKPDEHTIDLTHAFYTEQMQINNGSMNKFVAYGNSQGLTMSYYDATDTYIGQLAKSYTLMDRWHHAGFGGSWFNHIWLICPNAPVFPNAPPEIVNQVEPDGKTLVNPDEYERSVTPDYFAVNTIYSPQPPTPAGYNTSWLLPLQNLTTIGDIMTENQVSWKWFSGGYTDAMNGNPDPTFQYHHQPFIYFSNYAVGKPGRDHLADETDLLSALKNGNLPQVSFYKPLGKYNMHPDYSIVTGEAQEHLKMIVESIQNSTYWKKSLVFITFDEHGGRWDHEAPPVVDRWGPGSRIPTILVSPLVKKGYIDNTYHDSTSIMKFIQDRFNLPSIGTRDAAQNGLDAAFLQASKPKSKAWVIVIIAPLIILLIGVGAIAYAVYYAFKHRNYEKMV